MNRKVLTVLNRETVLDQQTVAAPRGLQVA